MNTKGMKFLAVLAVLAMAFAAFAVLTTTETDDAATVNVGDYTIIEDNDAVYYPEAGEEVCVAATNVTIVLPTGQYAADYISTHGLEDSAAKKLAPTLPGSSSENKLRATVVSIYLLSGKTVTIQASTSTDGGTPTWTDGTGDIKKEGFPGTETARPPTVNNYCEIWGTTTAPTKNQEATMSGYLVQIHHNEGYLPNTISYSCDTGTLTEVSKNVGNLGTTAAMNAAETIYGEMNLKQWSGVSGFDLDQTIILGEGGILHLDDITATFADSKTTAAYASLTSFTGTVTTDDDGNLNITDGVTGISMSVSVATSGAFSISTNATNKTTTVTGTATLTNINVPSGKILDTSSATAITITGTDNVVKGTINDTGKIDNNGTIANDGEIVQGAEWVDKVGTITGTGTIVMSKNSVGYALTLEGTANVQNNILYTSTPNYSSSYDSVEKINTGTNYATFYANTLNKAITLKSGAEFAGTITYVQNFYTSSATSSLTNYATHVLDVKLKSGDNPATITTGSLVIAGTFAALSGSHIVQVSGDAIIGGVTLTSMEMTFGGAMTKAIDSTLTLTSSRLNIDEEASISIKGYNGASISVGAGSILNVEGKVTMTEPTTGAGNYTITGSGTVIKAENATISAMVTAASTMVLVDEDGMAEVVVTGDSAALVTTYPVNQKVIVSGTWTLGDGARVTINGKLVVPAGTTLYLEGGAWLTLANSSKMIVEGSVIIDEQAGATDAKQAKLIVGSGSVAVSGTMSVDDIIDVAANQSFTVEDGGVVTIQDDGVLTTGTDSAFVVAKGGQLNVYGTFNETSGATVYNYGKVVFNTSTPAKAASVVYQMGDGAEVEVLKYTIDGAATYQNAATLTISDDGMQLYAFRDTDNHTTKYVTKSAYDQIAIGLQLKNGSSTVNSSDYTISFSNITAISSVSSKSTTDADNITEGIYNGKEYSKAMALAGNLQASYIYVGSSVGESTYTAKATVTSDGASVKVKDTIQIGDNVTFANNSGTMAVTGCIYTESSKGVFTNSAKVHVSGNGIIKTVAAPISSESGISAAKLVVPTLFGSNTVNVYTYVSLDAALAYLAESNDVDTITVLASGTATANQSVTKDATLYAGDTIVVSGDMGIKSGSTLTIAKGATLKGTRTITVDGTLYALDRTDVKTPSLTIVSDVLSQETDAAGKVVKTGWAMWTSLATAIENMGSQTGTVTVTKASGSFVYIRSNLTIPENVTVNFPAGYADMFICDGVTVTVNGTLIANANVYAQQKFSLTAFSVDVVGSYKYSSAIVINGTYVTENNILYEDGATSATKSAKYSTDTRKSPLSAGAPVAGAYYKLDNGYNVISSLAIAMQNLDDINGNITINGKVTAGDIVFSATEYCSAIVVSSEPKTEEGTTPIINTLTVDSLTLDANGMDAVALNVPGTKNQSVFNGNVIGAEAAVGIVGASNFAATVSYGQFVLSGNADLSDKGDTIEIMSGTVYMNGFKPQTYSAKGSVNGKDNNGLYSTYVVVDAGATLVAKSGNEIHNIIVFGTLSVPSNKDLKVQNIEIYGNLVVAPTTTTSPKGTFTLTSDLAASTYVEEHMGIMAIGMDGAIYETQVPAAAAASVTGPIDIAGTKVHVYVLSGSTIGDELQETLDGLSSTVFYLEGKEWFTAYAATGSSGYAPVISAVGVDNAILKNWVDQYGNVVNKNTALVIGNYLTLTAVLDYDLYTIRILADQGVKNVSIDGKLLTSEATGSNYFVTTTEIAAGTHSVTYELYSGYEGTAMMSLQGISSPGITATILGTNFTVSGDVEGTVYFQLSGIEESGEPTPVEKSEWTITTILLVILVILIAVMAVIVALRLNRS